METTGCLILVIVFIVFSHEHAFQNHDSLADSRVSIFRLISFQHVNNLAPNGFAPAVKSSDAITAAASIDLLASLIMAKLR